jgi:hypothetical protein
MALWENSKTLKYSHDTFIVMTPLCYPRWGHTALKGRTPIKMGRAKSEING